MLLKITIQVTTNSKKFESIFTLNTDKKRNFFNKIFHCWHPF